MKSPFRHATGSLLFATGVAVSLALLSIAPARAQVLDFESLATTNNTINVTSTPYIEDGFQIDGFELAYWGTLESRYPSSTALFENIPDAVVTLSKVGGGVFDLTSIDVSELNSPGSVTVTFVGTLPSSATITQTITTDGIFGLETFTLSGFTGVTQVQWQQINQSYHQFDNIVLNGGGSVAPEPGTIAFLAFGLSALGITRRIRKA